MTTITDTLFFSPVRDTEFDASHKKRAFRPLIVSLITHILGIAMVIYLSQLGLEKTRSQIAPTRHEPTIEAVLYYPSTTKKTVDEVPINENVVDVIEQHTNIETSELNDNIPATPQLTEVSEQRPVNTEEKIDTTPSPQTPIVKEVPTTSNANQRAGQLNLSAKDAAAQYFNSHNNDRLALEAATAARQYQAQKTRPNIVDTRKGQPVSEQPLIPTKRVNCSSTTNKTLAILSGFTGGTLTCTEMDDHNRFIDARVKKRPKNNR